MSNSRRISINNVFDTFMPASVGFDQIFNDLHHFTNTNVSNGFPPHNIIKASDTKYRLEFALAGYPKERIDVSTERGVLTIKSLPEADEEWDDEFGDEYVHQGISKRDFSKQFKLGPDMKVMSADMKDGMLYILVEQIVPKKDQLTSIKIK